MPYVDPEIRVAEVGDLAAVVAVHGELDLSAADRFRAALRDGSQTGSRRVVVDLVGTTFIDSTALGVISGASKTFRRSGVDLTVVANDPRILRIFKLTGLDRSIRVERSLAEAIARRSPDTVAL